uniref:N-terminal E2 ubiquitin-conjugating enzyme n=1 Tax=Caenorhabditis japonica TaxID=281687 RepID=A0A8R1IF81_CAEJA
MDEDLLLDHLVQFGIKCNIDKKVVTCAKYDQKYKQLPGSMRLENHFPEKIIGCKLLEKDKKIVTVTSRNTLTIRKSSNLKVEQTLQCNYFATSICSLILGETVEELQVFFGSVIGDLVDWKPLLEETPMQRNGHKGMIFAIASCNSRLFTISDDRTIRMWSVEKRECGPIQQWKIGVVGAEGTLYAGEVFTLQFTFGPQYPFNSPEVMFVGETIPAHPHIYSNGHICLSILSDDWTPALSVQSVCLSILSMLSSAREKKHPIDDAIYVRTCNKNPSKTRWWFHDDSV